MEPVARCGQKRTRVSLQASCFLNPYEYEYKYDKVVSVRAKSKGCLPEKLFLQSCK